MSQQPSCAEQAAADLDSSSPEQAASDDPDYSDDSGSDDMSGIDSDGSDDYGDAGELGAAPTLANEKYTKPDRPATFNPAADGNIRVEAGPPRLQAKLAKALLDYEMLEQLDAGLWAKMLLTVPTYCAHIYDTQLSINKLVRKQARIPRSKHSAYARGRGRVTTPPMQDAISGVPRFTVDQLVAAGVPRAVAEQLVPVCTKHSDQLLRAIVEALRRVGGNLEDLVEVSVTAAAADTELEEPLPAIMLCELEQQDKPSVFKAYEIMPGQTIVFKGVSAFFIRHQLFCRAGSYSVRMRYVWVDEAIMKSVKAKQQADKQRAS